MSDRFRQALTKVLGHEGGYVDDPHDPGGATNLGVTIGTARIHKLDMDGDGDVDKLDVRRLTLDAVAPVYHRSYWLAASCDKLPAGLDYIVFDCAVNQGVGRATRWLQEAVGAKPDGMIGPATLAKVAAIKDVDAVVNRFADLRLNHYCSLSTFARFGRGWTRRLNEVEDTALAWAA